MSSWVIILPLLAASSMWFSQGEAAQCAEICYTTELTGFGPGGAAGCSCSGSKATRGGKGGCSCGQCYDEVNGVIIGYTVNSDGTCIYGTNCGDCTRSPDSTSSKPTMSPSSTSSKPTTSPSSTTTNPTTSPSSTTTNPTTSPSSTTTNPTTLTPTTSLSSTTATTDVPVTTSSVPSSDTLMNTTTAPFSSSTDPSKFPATPNTFSSSSSDNAGEIAGSSDPNRGKDNGLKTWQIALIICCGVLLFTVAVVSLLSCYCKARNRLNENEDNLADVSYYQQQHARQHSYDTGSGVPTPTLFTRNIYSHPQTGSSGSLNNEMKPMYANSANSGSSDRLGMGLAPVHMRSSSSGDLAGMAGSYLNERILSGSYPIDRRQSSSNRSQGRQLMLEPRYSATHDREPLAVEL